MEIKLVSLTGFVLVLAGLSLIFAQFIWPDHFAGITKTLGVTLQTDEVSFGVIVIGALLLLAAMFKSKVLKRGYQ